MIDDDSDIESLYGGRSAPPGGPATEPDDTRPEGPRPLGRDGRYNSLLRNSERQNSVITELRESLVKLQSAHKEFTEHMGSFFEGGRNLKWRELTDLVTTLSENQESLRSTMTALEEAGHITQAHESRIGELVHGYADHDLRLDEQEKRLNGMASMMSTAGSALCGLTGISRGQTWPTVVG